ncbi:dTDP-4-dehydrorhamnose reductase [Bacillus sp. THAF10]|uniref:dTDP-4-dehydrorhamnose reductase n=1 Tax=Bacillus sp. THAF10 TaxID=2587848 RepID=UPI00126932E5|nr:dTDP-4-dehydrorhamnose reductase [Bacillus sp. THAF10]QFT88419.1 dTDP-4-dehydrorhamnose reductase [Bacillus sp. THAF10]
MKVLVTGAKGQLGFEIVKMLNKKKVQTIGLNRLELDVTNRKKVEELLWKHMPDVVIHSAAYTNVALAEKEPEKAYQVNSLGAKNVAKASESIGASLCYISTDYVFDGMSKSPYTETDLPNPQNIYGMSKYLGEKNVQALCSKYFIVRTSWLYGSNGNNFVRKIIEKAESSNEIEVVNDQFGSPTYTRDLAIFLLELIKTGKFGIYHATNSGSCSWFEFASEIFRELNHPVVIKAVNSDRYISHVYRPKNSVLDNSAIIKNGFNVLPSWREALKDFLTI